MNSRHKNSYPAVNGVRALIGLSAALCLSALSGPAGAQLSVLGAAAHYAVLAYDSGTITLAGGGVTGPTGLVGTNIVGNVGVGSGGSFSASDGTLDGNLSFQLNQSLSTSGSFHVTAGHTVTDHVAAVGTALSDATSASQQIKNMSVTQTLGNSTVNLGANQHMTITATQSGVNVINLNSITLNNATLTFSGGGFSNVTFYINVAGDITVNGGITQNIGGNNIHVGIDTTGGLQFTNLLFNLSGSGNKVKLTSNALVQGTLLNPNGNTLFGDEVTLSGGTVQGEIIAGNITLVSSSQVLQSDTSVNDVVPEGASLSLIWGGLLPLAGLGLWRRGRRASV